MTPYFIHSGDHVQCHFCDGGLKNWDPTDCPFVEHAKWFGQCQYLLWCRCQSFAKASKPRGPSSATSHPQQLWPRVAAAVAAALSTSSQEEQIPSSRLQALTLAVPDRRPELNCKILSFNWSTALNIKNRATLYKATDLPKAYIVSG